MANVFYAWRWGDWRNWKKYQSTTLYLITCDLLYNFLCYNYPLWEYNPKIFNLNHTLLNLIVMFIGYPAFILVYLGRFPSGRIKQILWFSFWVIYWSFFEWVYLHQQEFSYHNGWKFVWSVVLNLGIYSMIPLHYKKPLFTYALSIIVSMGLLIIFKVPVTKMR
ncbi:CBO0543 family protein [Alicyclobacillus fastidiosus]|uniref:CBO0543 family protein n=1 Tax=Alicyclobacillus fastidiosus TaxID=392011 RepID=UPI0034D65301